MIHDCAQLKEVMANTIQTSNLSSFTFNLVHFAGEQLTWILLLLINNKYK